MTEAEWLACNDPRSMLYFLTWPDDNDECRASNRQIHLFASACCRHVWDELTDQKSRRAVEVMERFADGQATEEELFRNVNDTNSMTAGRRWRPLIMAGTQTAAAWSYSFEGDLPVGAADLVRDIFGNPFQPVLFWHEDWLDGKNPDFPKWPGSPFRREWLTATVVSLADTIYTGRAFDRLPILADALEDAGCTNRDILDHCRQPGDHVRGCWVVDLVLGKE